MKKRLIEKIYNKISQHDLILTNVPIKLWQENGRCWIKKFGRRMLKYQPYKISDRELRNERKHSLKIYGVW